MMQFKLSSQGRYRKGLFNRRLYGKMEESYEKIEIDSVYHAFGYPASDLNLMQREEGRRVIE